MHVNRIIVRAVLAGCLLSVAGYLGFQRTRDKCAQWIGEVICRVEVEQRVVALSFDDGPTAVGVSEVLPVLARYNVHATFFLIGEDTARNPALVRRIQLAGHELGNHSYSHSIMIGGSAANYNAEIRRTDALLRQAGADPTLFRPPGGRRFIGLPLAVEHNGYRMITWSAVDEPWARITPSEYAAHMLAQVRPGAILLMHPMNEHFAASRAALPLILEGLKRRGYRVTTVSGLIRLGEVERSRSRLSGIASRPTSAAAPD
ncbi:polysaccharide deacetylase family protein [Sphingomonas sp.]|uniref:polysaccharide deacetylase family protein n=1 Tax=Sphingomonas sp. TaxID=28214 RepID=UPI003D6D55E3